MVDLERVTYVAGRDITKDTPVTNLIPLTHGDSERVLEDTDAGRLVVSWGGPTRDAIEGGWDYYRIMWYPYANGDIACTYGLDLGLTTDLGAELMQRLFDSACNTLKQSSWNGSMTCLMGDGEVARRPNMYVSYSKRKEDGDMMHPLFGEYYPSNVSREDCVARMSHYYDKETDSIQDTLTFYDYSDLQRPRIVTEITKTKRYHSYASH